MTNHPPCFNQFSLLARACRDCAFRGPCASGTRVGGFGVLHQPRYSAPPVVELSPAPKTGKDKADLLRHMAEAGLRLSGFAIRGPHGVVARVDAKFGYFMLHVWRPLPAVAALPAARHVDIRACLDSGWRSRVKSSKKPRQACTVLSPSESACVRIAREIVGTLA